MDILIQILMAFAGSLGFALMLNVKKDMYCLLL